MGNSFIPVNEPILVGNEKKYLNECIDSGWISSEGPFVNKFEQKISKYVGRKHGIAVANGTAAIDIAVEALGIGSGDEVILPTFTIISCITQIIRSGAKPVLVDADPNTFCMDVSQIEQKISKKTKAILAVHIYGLPVNMTEILLLAKKYNLKVIEDAAEAIGQTYHDKKCGSMGDISIFSFYPNKHITTGEGGMILVDDDSLAQECRSLRNLCFLPEKRFLHKKLGWNYRFTNLQAAVGLAQFEKLDAFIEKKRNIGTLYNSQLKDLISITLPLRRTTFAENIFWVYSIIIKDSKIYNAESVMTKLLTHGIGSRPFFYPLHQQPIFKEMGLFVGESYPVAEYISTNGFYLPSGLALTDQQIDYVSLKVKEIFEQVKK